MGDKSAIEWTDATWNPIVGCSIVSPGCTNCYAMRTAGARTKHTAKYQGLTQPSKAGPVWTGEVRFWETALTDPLKWAKPRRVFVNSMGDLFHEQIPDEWIDRVFAVMALAPQHTFQVLTKRPERMRAYFAQLAVDDLVLDGLGRWHAAGAPILGDAVSDESWEEMLGEEMPLPNVWLGVSCEDQRRADERIPILLDTPAAVRFISAEPLLGPINVRPFVRLNPFEEDRSEGGVDARAAVLDWVIAGGESGPHSRPMHPDWPRLLRDQCAHAGTPFFFKQWGEWAPHQPVAGGDLGGDVRAGRVRIVHPTAQSDVEVSIATSGLCDRSCLSPSRCSRPAPGGRSTISGSRYMANVGKKNSGRVLGGRTWDQYPEVPAHG